MKRSYIILMLIAVLTLTVFCSAIALAASSDDTVSQLYPTLDGDAALGEDVYAVSFDDDVVITFRDVPFKYGRLSLGELAYGKYDENRIRDRWKDWNWELGDGYQVYVETDKSFFMRADENNNNDENADDSDAGKRTVTYCIGKTARDNFKSYEIDYFCLEFCAGNEPDDLKPIWRGRICNRDSKNVGYLGTPIETQNITLSLLQFNCDNEDKWLDDVYAEGDDVPGSIRVRAVQGYSIEYGYNLKDAGQEDVVERRIDAWTDENGAPYVVRLIRDENADGQEVTVKKEGGLVSALAQTTGTATPSTGPAAESSPAPSASHDTDPSSAPSASPTEESSVAPTLELVQVRYNENGEPVSEDENDGEIPLVLAREDEKGNYLPVVEAPVLLDPGEYMLVLRNAEEDAEVKITLSEDDSQLPVNLPVAANGEGQKVQVKAGKRITLTIRETPTDDTITDGAPTDGTFTDGTHADETYGLIDVTPTPSAPLASDTSRVEQDGQLTQPAIVLLGKVTAPVTLDKVTLGEQTLFSNSDSEEGAEVVGDSEQTVEKTDDETASKGTETSDGSEQAVEKTDDETASKGTETGDGSEQAVEKTDDETASKGTETGDDSEQATEATDGDTTSQNTKAGGDPAPIAVTGNDDSNDMIINRASCDRLIFGGTAEPGVALNWELRYGENPKPIQEGVLDCDESGTWSVEINLMQDTFADLEGELHFSICYGVEKEFLSVQEGKESANYSLKIDTKPPEGYIEFVYGDECVTGNIIFEERKDATIKVNAGEIINGTPVAYANGVESGSDATGLRVDESRADEKVFSYTYTLRDDAGNESTVQATVRLVQPIGIDEASAADGETSIADGEWINLACKGRTIELSGTCEIREAIEYAFTVSDQEPVWQDDKSDSDGGKWTVSYELPEDLPEEGTLHFSVRYKDEDLREALGESELRSWKIDLLAPDAPKLSILIDNDNADSSQLVNGGNADSFQLVTGRKLQILVDGSEDAESISFTKAVHDGASVDVKEAFIAESGMYAFEAVAQDAAGNRSEASTLEIEVADPVMLLGFIDAEGNILNTSALQEGNLTLLGTADAGRRDLIVKCRAGDQEIKNVPHELDEKGEMKIVIPSSELPKGNQGSPIELELSVQYKGLNPDTFGATWTGRVDLWAPTVQIAEIATYGNKSNDKYFRGERVLVKLLLSDGAPELTVVSGDEEIEVGKIEAEQYNAYLNAEYASEADSDGKTAAYYEFPALDSDKYPELRLTAMAVDAAENASSDSKELTRYTSTKKIEVSGELSGIITGQEGAAVTVKGKNGVALYYLVIDGDESGRKIPIGNNSTWELKLTYADLPKGFVGDVWEIVLRYPDDSYNTNSDGEDMTCTIRIPVDVDCKLAWEESEPKLNDNSISVATEPGASVKLYLNGENKGEVQAGENGIAVLDLADPLGMGTRIQVTATDVYENKSTIEYEITDENADVKALKLNPIRQEGDRIVVTGTGTANMPVVLTLKNLDGQIETQTQATVDKGGSFEIKVDMPEMLESGDVQICYEGLEKGGAEARYEMDRIPPELELVGDKSTISDVGGEVTASTEKDATITARSLDAAGDSFDVLVSVEMQGGEAVIRIPRLDESAERIELIATDTAGNDSKPLVLAVEAAPGVRGGFDVPVENGVVDSRGELPVSGWIATRDDGEPEGLALVITQGEMSWTLKPGKDETVTLQEDDGRLKDEAFKSALDETMKANHCWSFAYTLPMENWDKGEIVLSLTQNGAEISRCSFTSGVDAKRKYGYIVICCLSLVGLAACALVLVSLNRRIRRISDGRINPDSGMSKLTERDRQQPGQ